MRIGWVGGLDRSRALFSQVAERAGHTLEMHEGHVGGRGTQNLEGVVARCDILVIVVDTNSHGAVLNAKKMARRCGRRALIVRKGSVTALERVIESLRTG
jgi:Uncharacterized protein conserved in bacteria (DUF2325)